MTPPIRMVSEEEFDLLFYKLKDLILEQSEGEWDDATIVRDAHHFANHLRPLLTAAPVREEGGVVLAKRVSPGEAINRAVGDEVLTAKALESITTAGWVFAHKDDIATREEAPAEAGERDVIARLVDPQTFDLIASYTGIDRGDGLTPAERESAVFGAYPKLKEDRDTAFAKADTIIALRAQPQARSGEG